MHRKENIMVIRKKDYRWYVIAVLSLISVFSVFLPFISVKSDIPDEKRQWNLQQLWQQTQKLDSILDSKVFRPETDEEELDEDAVSFLAEFDTSEIQEKVEKLKTNFLLICGAAALTAALNVICFLSSLAFSEVVKYIFVIVTCFFDIGTALLIRASCHLQVRAISPITETLEDLGKKFDVLMTDVTDFAAMKPGISCLFLLVMAFLSAVIMLMIRAGSRR